jgi:type IV secretion system protein VirD4
MGRELMTTNELATLDGRKCVLLIRGVNLFLSKKYDLSKHKYFKEIKDGNPKMSFFVEKYIEEMQKIRKYGFSFSPQANITVFKM